MATQVSRKARQVAERFDAEWVPLMRFAGAHPRIWTVATVALGVVLGRLGFPWVI